MSTKSLSIVFFSLFIIIISAAGCKKKCGVCDYGTACNNGYCFCPNGYEGDSCKKLSSTKYVGSYTVSDPCSGSSSYNLSIYADPYIANKLWFNGLFGQSIEVDIYSDASKQGITLGIPDQNFGVAEVTGTGTYQAVNGYARITLNVDYVSGGVDRPCTVILQQY